MYGYHLKIGPSVLILNAMLNGMTERLEKSLAEKPLSPQDRVEAQREMVEEILDLLDLSSRWSLELSKEEAQNRMAKMLNETLGKIELFLWGHTVEQRAFPPNLVILAERLGFNVGRFQGGYP